MPDERVFKTCLRSWRLICPFPSFFPHLRLYPIAASVLRDVHVPLSLLHSLSLMVDGALDGQDRGDAAAESPYGTPVMAAHSMCSIGGHIEEQALLHGES